MWAHTSIFRFICPSLVLASKQDVRYTHNVSGRLVLAFGSGSRGLWFNICLYEATPTHSAQWAQQSEIRVGAAAKGLLLGAGVLTLDVQGRERVVIICPCENEVIVAQDVPAFTL